MSDLITLKNSNEYRGIPLAKIPPDIFRVIFQYLSVEDLMDGEEAFLNNQELLSLYRSSLQGFIINEQIKIRFDDELLISWLTDHKLLVESIEYSATSPMEMQILKYFYHSLKELSLKNISRSDSLINTNSPNIQQVGHFPSLISVTFQSFEDWDITSNILHHFLSLHPQLEIVNLIDMHPSTKLEILPQLVDFCPHIEILSFTRNEWMNDEDLAILTRGFPMLKSIDLRWTYVRNEATLRQFILSHPQLVGLSLSFNDYDSPPTNMKYSKDFLLFYLKQVIFPSILSQNNDLESHALSISSLYNCFERRIFDERGDIVNPEVFSVNIIKNMYHQDCSLDQKEKIFQIFYEITSFPQMIEVLVEANLLPILLTFLLSRPISSDHTIDSGGEAALDILSICCHSNPYLIHEIHLFPILFHRSPLFLIILCWEFRNYFSLFLSIEELQRLIVLFFNELTNSQISSNTLRCCLNILSSLLQDPWSQDQINSTELLFTLKSTISHPYFLVNSNEWFQCLLTFISLHQQNFSELLSETNLLFELIQLNEVTSISYLEGIIEFTRQCIGFHDEMLVDYLVNSGFLEYLLSNSQYSLLKRISLMNILLNYNSKYYEIVNEMRLSNEMRDRLFVLNASYCKTEDQFY